MNHQQRVKYAVRLLKAALQSPAVVDGIAQLTVAYRREHIRDGAGREGAFLPLKTVEGRWRDRKGRERTTTSYRAGGKPLRDTGALMNSQHASGHVEGGSIVVNMGGAEYGKWQDAGFRTSGPNFIPLTKAAKRAGSSQKAREQGMFMGKDFVQRRNGVTVPARPFIAPSREDIHQFGRNIYTGLRVALGGK